MAQINEFELLKLQNINLRLQLVQQQQDAFIKELFARYHVESGCSLDINTGVFGTLPNGNSPAE